MWRLIFGGIILLFVLGAVFLVGFVLGSTVTPLAPSASASATFGVVTPHA
ncbi:hypothetical protein [Leucobacter massiliensis]|nr:hypothetical protein [Leucobacter massiliensis]